MAKIQHGTFNACYNLKNIIIPENVTSIGSVAFSSIGLTEIVIPKNVSSIATSAFQSTCIAEFVVSEENNYYTAVDGVLLKKALDVLVK